MANKVYWLGRHANSPELGAPVSKIHAAGLNLLKAMDWVQVPQHLDCLPVFAFTTRKGANYPADRAGLPTVRQLPHANTACLDNKRNLHRHLHAAGQQQLLPPSWSSMDDLLSWLASQQQQAAAHDSSTTTTSSGSSSGGGGNRQLPGSMFIKHRRGVKGQAVYLAHTLEQLQQVQQKLKHSAADFIVQQEVPPMLLHGRKFVMRVHVLVTHTARRMYMHEDVIVLKHACDYAPASSSPAVHISSKGVGHPAPLLLQQLPDLHAQAWPQLQHLVALSMDATAHVLFPGNAHPEAVLYHLFGYDCMVDAAGRVVLLEVNSYPAIASGTMAAVEVGVYTRLVRDMVTLLVLPVTDGLDPDRGGFVPVE